MHTRGNRIEESSDPGRPERSSDGHPRGRGTPRERRARHRRSGEDAPVGLLVIDKPAGMSSMTAVSIVRRKIGCKAGHAGTLDPLATGVLVVAVGRATKSIDRFMDTRKVYRTEIDLSAFTATDDREGEPEEVRVAEPPTTQDVARALETHFLGEFLQTPPDFSAKKVDGRRAYAVARKGEAPKLEPRSVRVHRIELEAYEWPLATVEVECDKGFYVRSLARELGGVLGTGGHCASIRRLAVGPFGLDGSFDPDDLPDPMPDELLTPLPEALERLVSRS